ncbi:MAG: YceI family protein [Gemmatimonadaceae bacterium]
MEPAGALLNAAPLVRFVLILAAVAPAWASAQAAAPEVSWVLRSGTLSFVGHATVGDFVGSTSTVSGAAAGDLAVGSARGWVEAPVTTLVTNNGRRDRDLRSSMEVARYPTMRFDLDSARVSTREAGGGACALRLHGSLAVHGVRRAVDLPAMASHSADTLHLTAEFGLDLKDYNIGGLIKLAGLLRMQRQIEVRVDLRFLRATNQ